MFTFKFLPYLVLFVTAVTHANSSIPTVSMSIRQEYFECDRIRLECFVTGNPTPTIEWTRENGQPLPSTAQKIDTYMIIENAKQEHSGDYRCTASNSAGTASRVTTVAVISQNQPLRRNKLTASPSSPNVLEGQNTYVACNGTEVGPWSLRWFRGRGRPLPSNIHSLDGLLFIKEARIENEGVYICRATSEIEAEGNFTSRTSQKGNKLIITNAQDADGGLYKCTGTVDGIAIASANIPVEVESRIAPKIKTSPQGELVTVTGKNAELRCGALEGVPPPALEWSRSNGELSSNAQITSAGVLMFTNISYEDDGEYICKATNEVGNDTSSVTVKVRYQLRLRITPGHDVTFESYDMAEDELLSEREVKCMASGCPDPIVSIKKWEKSGFRVIVPPRPNVALLRFFLSEEKRFGTYMCFGTCRDQVAHQLFTVEKYTPMDIFGPTKILVTEGEDATLRCGTRKSEDFETKIAKVDGPNGEAFWNRPSESERIIRNATKQDSGTYACYYSFKSKHIPTQAETIMLDVMRLPRITIAPENLTIPRRESATVECDVEDDSILDVSWDITEKASRHVKTNGTKLILYRMRTTDAGNYTCFARNKIGLSSAVVQVTVTRGSNGVDRLG